jgi:acetylornithine/succinyldiaminopimelate/putrescine aminotransferase
MEIKRYLEILKNYEERNLTFIDKDFPPILQDADGVFVFDSGGNRYIDLTSFFGVSFSGHSQKFIKDEIERGFYHGAGDYLPNIYKIELMEKLSKLTGKDFKGILLENGSDAIEFCLRTAYLYKKSKKFISFKGGYHGTTLTPLSVTHSLKFRKDFEDILPFEAIFFDFSINSIKRIKRYLSENNAAGIILEPIQGRAGIKIPDNNFLKEIESIAKEFNTPLIFDEMFTGIGKTGKIFAKDYFDVKPDMIAFGKALTSSFPLSACFGKPQIMDIWGESKGEAKFTMTFTGNPFFSRIALKNLKFMEKSKYEQKVKKIEVFFKNNLKPFEKKYKDLIKEIRGIGVLWGIEFIPPLKAFDIVKHLFKEGFITLPSGENGETIEIIPPFIIDIKELKSFIYSLEKILETFK